MPKELEAKLKREAKKKFGTTTSKRARKYIYGTLRKTGWTPSTQKKGKKKTGKKKWDYDNVKIRNKMRLKAVRE